VAAGQGRASLGVVRHFPAENFRKVCDSVSESGVRRERRSRWRRDGSSPWVSRMRQLPLDPSTVPSLAHPWLRRAAQSVVPLALLGAAQAHQVLPFSLDLRSGGSDYIAVVDLGGCTADIQAVSSDPDFLKVYAVDMSTGAILPGDGASAVAFDRVDQLFLVQASVANFEPGTEWIEICWVGSDFPDPPCDENNCSPYDPKVVPVFIEPMPLTSGASLWSAFARDPANAASGELVLLESADLDLGGPNPVRLERYYASRQQVEGNVVSALGPGWSHNFDWRLVQSTNFALEVVTPTGRVLPFVRGPFDGTWSLEVATDVPYRLLQIAGGFRLGDPVTGLVYRFDAQGRLDRIVDANGNALTLVQGASGPTSIADGLGRELTLSYTSGRLTGVGDGTRSVVYAYDASDRLASATNPEGETTTYTYDGAQPAQALLTARTLPLGNTPYTQTWDAKGRVKTQSDALGNTWTFSYVPKGTTTVTDPKGRTNVFVHDEAGRLLSFTDEAGETITLAYDGNGRRSSVADREGASSSMGYHGPSGKLASVTDADGAATALSYQARTNLGLTFHDLVGIARPGGALESWTRDQNGNLSCWTDAAGKEWSYQYGPRGELLVATDPKGKTRTFAYNADLTLASVTDEDGELITLGYDALRRLTSITQATKGAARMLSYDLCDRVTGFTDDAGGATGAVYDDNGRLGWLTLPDGGLYTLDYDLNDALRSVSDPLGNESSVARDAFSRIQSLTDGGGVTLDVKWDLRGRLKGLDDALGLAWTVTSDGEGLRDTSTGPGEEALDLCHDERGNWTRLRRGLSLVMSADYDAQGDLESLSTGDGSQVALQRDARRLVTGFDLPLAGSSTQLQRESRGYVTGLTTPGGGQWGFARDARGFLGSITDPQGNQTQYQRNARGWTIGVTYPGGLGTGSFEWGVDGLLTRRLYSDGLDVQYTHDVAGRLDTTLGVDLDWDLAGRMSGSNGIMAWRDGGGRVTWLELAPGKLVQYGWGLGGELRSVATWFGATWTFDYDGKGRRRTIQRPNGLETRYTWNALGSVSRLWDVDTQPAGGGDEITLSDLRLFYDALDRLIEVAREFWFGPVRPQLGQAIFSYDLAARQSGSVYDARGFVIDDGTFSLDWDLAGRLQQVAGPGLTYAVGWNGLDAPTSIDDGSIALDFVWNYTLESPRISVVAQTGTPIVYYVHTPDGTPLASVDAATDESRFFHFDDTGSTQFVSDDDGEVVATSVHDAYGQAIVETGLQDLLVGWRGAKGALSMRELGFTWELGRIYDPQTLRYLSPASETGFDPITSNPYVLDGGDPVGGAREDAGRSESVVEEAVAHTAGSTLSELDLSDAAPTIDAQVRDVGELPRNLLTLQQRMLLALMVRWTFYPLGFTDLRRLPVDARALIGLQLALAQSAWSNADPDQQIEVLDLALLPPNATQAVVKFRMAYVTAMFLFPQAFGRRMLPLHGMSPVLQVALLSGKGASILARLQRALDVEPRHAREDGLRALIVERPEQLESELARVPVLSRIPILAALFAASPQRPSTRPLSIFLLPHLVRQEEY
jgi:YD repeat-containing protein